MLRTTMFVLLALFLPSFILGQAEGIDTTSESYRRRYEIGKSIGSWLPFLVIFTLALMVVIRTYRVSQKDK